MASESLLTIMIILPPFVSAIVVIHVKMLRKRERDRERFRKAVSRLKEEIRRRDMRIQTLSRPRYGQEPEFQRSEKAMMEGIRIIRTVNSKKLASFLNLSESTIRNRIFNICRKMNFHSRAELLAYVMLSVPED